MWKKCMDTWSTIDENGRKLTKIDRSLMEIDGIEVIMMKMDMHGVVMEKDGNG